MAWTKQETIRGRNAQMLEIQSHKSKSVEAPENKAKEVSQKAEQKVKEMDNRGFFLIRVR